MKIFILEDDNLKFQSILNCLSSTFVGATVVHSKYFNEAIHEILNGDFDYAIIDNNVPRFKDSSIDFVTNAIETALEYIYLNDNPVKVIGCSSDIIKLKDVPLNYLGQVKHGRDGWKDLLIHMIHDNENKKVL